MKLGYLHTLFWVAFVSLQVTANAAPLANTHNFKEKVDYTILDQPASKQPEVTQFFSFYCPHCRSFEPVMDKLRAQLPLTIKVERIPAPAGRTPQIAKLLQQSYAFSVSLQKDQPFMDHLFDEIQLDKSQPKNRIQAYQMVLDKIYAAMGRKTPTTRTSFTEDDIRLFKQKINSTDLTKLAQAYTDKVHAYNIHSVPTIVVNGRYQVHQNAMSSPERFQELVKYLLALNNLNEGSVKTK